MFLESAGRPDAIASDTEGAVGLTQILAETGQNLLGMKIDVARSRHYSRRIRRELLRGAPRSRSRRSSAPAPRSTSASIPPRRCRRPRAT